MRILFIGDVVARPGRVAVLERIEDLREQNAVDIAVMNAENVAGGFSITPSMAEELFAAGVDVMTSGNHIFDKREAAQYIERQPRLLRPANYSAGTPGRGLWVGEVRGARVAVMNLMGFSADGLGNHNFDKGSAYLRNTLIPLANYPFISANVVDANGKTPAQWSPSKVFDTTFGGGDGFVSTLFGGANVGQCGFRTTLRRTLRLENLRNS